MRHRTVSLAITLTLLVLTITPGAYGSMAPPDQSIEPESRQAAPGEPIIAAENLSLDVPPAPALLYPPNGAQLNTLIPVTRIDTGISVSGYSYQIEISSDPNFTAVVGGRIQCGWFLSEGTHQPDGNLLPNTQHFWRARSNYENACTGPSSSWGPWSGVWTFTTGANGTIMPGPALTSPSNGDVVFTARPTLTWQNQPGSLGTMIFGREVGVPYLSFWQMRFNIVTNSYQVSRDLIPGKTYEWWVLNRNDYAWGIESMHWTFTVELPRISGRIVDASGNGIAGVEISDGADHSATSDGNGNYTLTGLSEGDYTLTASKAGYTFCPRSRSISVPPNQTGQDFSGSFTGTDLGFCSEPNGFGFPNTQLWRTWPMFEQFYGSAAVRNTDGSICTTAQQYFDQTYRGVANGWSSAGFTLGSLHSYQSRPQPNAGPFAIAPYSNLYEQPLSSQLTSPIAYYSGVQLSAQYQNEYQSWLATCAADPNQMVARLQQAIQTDNPLLLGLKAGSVYHAVTPYRVVTVSPTETHIYVYDSEAPGQQRVVHMQRSGSGWQWQYSFVGSLASAGTRTGGCSDMFYYQASASLEQGAPLVDLCAEARGAAPDGTGKLLSVLPAAGNWYLQDSVGRRLGWAAGQWVSEIPRGYELPQTVSDAAPPQRLLYLPVGAYTVRANAGASRAVDYSLFADGRVLQVDGQTAAAGVTSVIGVSPGMETILVAQPDQFTSLAIELVQELPGVSRVAGLSGSAIAGSAELAITFDGQAVELARASGSMTYQLRFFQPGTNTGYFASAPIALEPDEAHRLTPASWNGLGAGTVLLEIDEGRDGTVDETVTLTNQARSMYLPIVLSIR